MSELKIIFPTDEARCLFATWLSDGGGEQDYFLSLEHAGHPPVRISYHPENEAFPQDDKRRYGKFLEDGTIRVIQI